jgi:hypothetical protein
MHLPVKRRHTIHGRRKLFEIPYVDAEPVGDPARMLDFELGDIEFALAPAEETDSHPGLCKTDGEALADSAPRASDQRGHLLVRVQGLFYRLDHKNTEDAASGDSDSCDSRFFNPSAIQVQCRRQLQQVIAICTGRAGRHDSDGGGAKKILQFGSRPRMSEQKSLHQRTPGAQKSVSLTLRLHPFRYDVQSEALRDPDHGMNQPLGEVIGVDRLYERLIELNGIDRQPVQVTEGRKAGAEVVD